MFGAHEHDRFSAARCDFFHHLVAVFPRTNVRDDMVHRVHRTERWGRFMRARLMQKLVDDRLDLFVQGRRKQQVLAAFSDPADLAADPGLPPRDQLARQDAGFVG